MFCQPPEEEPQNTSKTNRQSRNWRKNVSKRKNSSRKNHNKNKSKLAVTMSSWAQNFTVAATWQLKHQLAYWKAKATSLEYENKILHDIIRKNHMNPAIPVPLASSDHSGSEAEDISDVIPDGVCVSDDELPDDDDDENFEVSEEFIEFLRANAKFKEDARKERERLRAETLDDNSVEKLEAGPSGHEDEQTMLKELYGDQWQRIAALEMSLQSDFIRESDERKPVYWPNIPLNL